MAAATKDSFARSLEALARKFEQDRDTYTSPGYPEGQARTHFINPFFKALRWDVENEAGVPYHLCEVWEEKDETHGRPDYTFRTVVHHRAQAGSRPALRALPWRMALLCSTGYQPVRPSFRRDERRTLAATAPSVSPPVKSTG